MSTLFDIITELEKPKQPKNTTKVDKFLEFEKQLRDLAKSKGVQPRTFLEQLVASKPELAKNKIIQKLLGEQDVPTQKGRDAKRDVLTPKAMNTVKQGIKQAAKKQRRRMDKDAVDEGAVKDYLMDLEDDATKMSKDEFVKKHGEGKANIWDKVNSPDYNDISDLMDGNEFAKKVTDLKAKGAKPGTKFKTSDGKEHTLEDLVEKMMLVRDQVAKAVADKVQDWAKGASIDQINKVLAMIKSGAKLKPEGPQSASIEEDRASDSIKMAKLKQAVGGETTLVKTLFSSAVQNNMDDPEFIDAASRMLNMPPQDIKAIIDSEVQEDDMSTGTVPVGKKGKTKRAPGINANPYDHNEGEDQPALVNAALWNMKDIYQTIMAGEAIQEDDMFSYGDLIQYLDMTGTPGEEFYDDFIGTISTAVSKAQPGGFAGQGDAVVVDKNVAPQIKTLYQKFKAATAKIKGVKEDDIIGAGDRISFEFDHNLAVETSILDIKENNILIQTDKLLDQMFDIMEAEYQGKKVQLNKPIRGGTKKFYVYVRDPKTKNIKKVSFGDTTGLSIKRDDPKRRKSFRARHNCDNPGPKTKARYWSCRMWTRTPVSKITKRKK